MFNQPDQNLKQGFNLYTWGGTKPTDPINYTDPSGNVSLSHLMLSGLFFLSGLLEFAAGNLPGGIADEVAAGFELDQGLTQKGDSKNDWANFGLTTSFMIFSAVLDYMLIQSIDESFVKFQQNEFFDGYKVGNHGGPTTHPINFDQLPEDFHNEGCPVCFEELNNEQKLIKGNSNHYYHNNCYGNAIRYTGKDPQTNMQIRPIFRLNKGSYLSKLKQVIIGKVEPDYALYDNSLLQNYFRRYKRILLLRAISASIMDVPHMLIKPLPDNDQGDENFTNIAVINSMDASIVLIKMFVWMLP
ncbi:RING finger protein [Facilibium subflavum]|uniref:hypothetical protein n=1 Tax=Facilibium subflavum TaxID=2219058 RepID=UPI000E64C773|nr:hypothetical protein [Facilibium subflavum]